MNNTCVVAVTQILDECCYSLINCQMKGLNRLAWTLLSLSW